MCRFLCIIAVILILGLPFSTFAEQGDVIIGDVALSGLTWGDQTVNIELENKTDYLKYVVTNTNLLFEGMYTNPEFKVRTTYLLEPLQKLNIAPNLYIPGNYGTATIKLDIYDVVDTLDDLMPWHKIYEQPFKITFHPSDEILPYLQEKVSFPPRVDVHPFFNNEFVRLLFTLLSEGKSVEEIAAMNNCDISFVKSQVTQFLAKKYLVKNGDSFKPNFPYITRKEAEDGKLIADKTSDKLAAIFAKNIGSYFDVIDSLATAKAIPRDKNDFISGAALLYKPTPVISTFVLWFELGKNFITRSAPLMIYDGTDICNTANKQYMYMVDGGPFLNGSHFFGLFYGRDSYSLMFSANPLDINCIDNFENIPAPRRGVWSYNVEKLPEFYIIDTTNVRPLISLMTKGCDEILKEAYTGLKKNAFAHGQDKVYIGHRYWFWNLVATLTLEKLYKDGTLTKRENSFFRFDKIKGVN